MVFRAWAKEMFVNRDVMFNEHEMENLVKPQRLETHEKFGNQVIQIEVKPAVTTEPEITTRKQQQTLVQIV